MVGQAFKVSVCFFFNDTATTEIYTLSLHDALPIYAQRHHGSGRIHPAHRLRQRRRPHPDRKSTRLNSSHSQISYAVFCLKKKHVVYHDAIGRHLFTRDALFSLGWGGMLEGTPAGMVEGM